jgi:hypothetical protein
VGQSECVSQWASPCEGVCSCVCMYVLPRSLGTMCQNVEMGV